MIYRALAVWHRELAKGKRTKSTYDTLWKMAAWEAAAQEAEAQGSHHTARRCMQRAKEIAVEASRKEAA